MKKRKKTISARERKRRHEQSQKQFAKDYPTLHHMMNYFGDELAPRPRIEMVDPWWSSGYAPLQKFGEHYARVPLPDIPLKHSFPVVNCLSALTNLSHVQVKDIQ